MDETAQHLSLWILLLLAALTALVISWRRRSRSGQSREKWVSLQLNRILQILADNPINKQTHQEVFQILSDIPDISHGGSNLIYSTALDILESNPESPLAKQFVLEVGRWHKGRIRDGGMVTIYDEQAIQNDILVRLTGS
jgi:hypothetical protein